MATETNDQWKLLDEKAAKAKESATSIQRIVAKMQQSITEGTLHKTDELKILIQDEILELGKQLTEISETTKSLRISSNELQKNVEALAKEYQISESIFSTTPNLVIYPHVIRFSESTKGPELAMGGEKFISNRPEFVFNKIKLHRKKPFNSEAFLKSLKAAYGLLIRNEGQREVSLESIRQVFSVSSDSVSKMSLEEFNTNLQILYSENTSGKKIEMPRFIAVAAAAKKYLLFGKDGSSISVGAISFSKSGSAE